MWQRGKLGMWKRWLQSHFRLERSEIRGKGKRCNYCIHSRPWQGSRRSKMALINSEDYFLTALLNWTQLSDFALRLRRSSKKETEMTKKGKGGFINHAVLRLGSRVTDWSSCSKEIGILRSSHTSTRFTDWDVQQTWPNKSQQSRLGLCTDWNHIDWKTLHQLYSAHSGNLTLITEMLI